MFDDIIIRPKKKNLEKKIIRESLPSNGTAEKEMKNSSPDAKDLGVTRVKKAKEMKKISPPDTGPAVTRVKKAKVK